MQFEFGMAVHFANYFFCQDKLNSISRADVHRCGADIPSLEFGRLNLLSQRMAGMCCSVVYLTNCLNPSYKCCYRQTDNKFDLHLN